MGNGTLEAPAADVAKDETAGASGNATNVLLLQIGLAIVTILVGKPHTMLHQMGWPLPQPGDVAKFNFIGVVGDALPSIWSVLLETAAWSFLGVVARAEYRLARMFQKRQQITAVAALGEILGDAAAGVSIAVALVALMWSSELNLIGIPITLKKGGIGSVIAVSFILGFFNNRTQKFLGLLQGKMFGEPDVAGAPSAPDSQKGSGEATR